MPKLKMLEKDIQSAILHYLWSIGYPAFHVPNHGKYDAKTNRYNRVDEDHVAGIPDIVVPCGKGRVCFFEVKSAEGHISKAQNDYGMKLISMGHNYGIVRSVAEVRQQLSWWGLSKERNP